MARLDPAQAGPRSQGRQMAKRQSRAARFASSSPTRGFSGVYTLAAQRLGCNSRRISKKRMARRDDFEKFIAAQKYSLPQRNGAAWQHQLPPGKYAAIFLKKCITAAAAFTPCAPPNWTNCQ